MIVKTVGFCLGVGAVAILLILELFSKEFIRQHLLVIIIDSTVIRTRLFDYGVRLGRSCLAKTLA